MNRIIILSYSSLLFKKLFFDTSMPERVDDIENMSHKKPELIILPYFEKISYHDEFWGVWEILIWLRIHNIMCHVCVVGNFPIESLLRFEKRAVMLSSRGVSYMQLPETLNQETINKKIADKADPENVRGVMYMLVDIQHMRHVYANIWGLERLVSVHKMYYKNFRWEASEDYKKQEKSLDYQIAKYVFVRGEKILQQSGKTIRAKEDLEDKLIQSNKKGLTVLLIDDKADSGWLRVFQSLLPGINIVSMPIDTYNENLITKFKSIDNVNRINIIISDLRLYPQEESEIDYNKLKSMELMKYIYDQDEYGKVHYILFTASNQLMNYKNVILSRYAPTGVYVKEGFDHIINPLQQDENYRNLVNALCHALYGVNENKYRQDSYRAGGRVDNGDPDEVSRIAYIERYKDTLQWDDVYKKIKKKLDQFDHVLIDTNIYYRKKEPFIALCGSEKIRCIYPVYKEMERISLTREISYRSHMASWACGVYEDRIFKEECLSLAHIEEIDKSIKVGKNLNNLADRYFLPAIINLLGINTNLKILFITNDNGPFNQVLNWAKQNHVNNVRVLRTGFLYRECNITLPQSVQVMGSELSKNGKAYNVVLSDGTKIDIPILNLESIVLRKTTIEELDNLMGKEYGYFEKKDLRIQIIKDLSRKK